MIDKTTGTIVENGRERQNESSPFRLHPLITENVIFIRAHLTCLNLINCSLRPIQAVACVPREKQRAPEQAGWLAGK